MKVPLAMQYRDLTTLEEFHRVVELEKLVWGYTDAEDVVPLPVLAVSVKRGGILVGAFDESNRMIGFVYSMPAMRDGRPSQWSHMLGVLDEYRGRGVGHQLKVEQRRRALDLGLELIEWTYDPLQALNAHLNFAKLGVVVEEYEENIYGESSSPLHHGSPTDRFVAEWWIRTPRVERRLAEPGPSIPSKTAIAGSTADNTARRVGDWLECEAFDVLCDGPALTVEIPVGFTRMQAERADLAGAWRMATRAIFTAYFRRGYRVVDFLLERADGRGRYLMRRKADF